MADRREIGEIFLRESPALYRYALRMTGSAQDAEEAVARTALRAVEKAGQFEGRSQIRTWLFGILLNVIRELKRESWREESVDIEAYPPNRDFDSTGHSIRTPLLLEENPENLLLRVETVERVRDEIDKLPPLQRSAFHLRYIEEWDPPEICNALGIQDTYLRVLLHRARLHLRDRLVEWVKGEEKT